jgi:2-keto-4-pentenoate hydratase/2-oxohepta-3-ene-1,7-dioic acid hydratase in catechol pathway
MKLVTFTTGGQPAVGVVDDEAKQVRDVTALLPPGTGVLELIENWAQWGPVLAERTAGLPATALDQVRLLAPIPSPRRDVFAVGKNYREHVASPGGDAFAHVWGYTIIDDFTARDLQRRHKQWTLGKGLDTHCPMGPYAVSADEIADVTTLQVQSFVNGEPRQDGPVKDLIFDIPELIAVISAGITLLPGDIIATGTPAGVGIGFDPPKFMVSGDVIEIAITGLGAQRNRIAD